jgi:uncharacterized protein (UPF0305 family)
MEHNGSNRELEKMLAMIPMLVQSSRFVGADIRRHIVDKLLKAIYQINKDLKDGASVNKEIGKQLPQSVFDKTTNEMRHYKTITDRFSKDGIEPYWQHLKEEYGRILHNHKKEVALQKLSKKNKLKKMGRKLRLV